MHKSSLDDGRQSSVNLSTNEGVTIYIRLAITDSKLDRVNIATVLIATYVTWHTISYCLTDDLSLY